MTVLARVLGLVRPRWGRLAIGLLAGALASGCAVALLATGAWLIARAAEQPPIAALSLGVVGVRAFAVGRAAFRYLERVMTHDATLRVLADLRVTVFGRLEHLAPAGLPALRRGDLLGRFVADVDGVQDVFVRALLPYAAGLLVSTGTLVFLVAVLPPAAAVVGAAVLLLAVALPAAVRRWSRSAEIDVVRARGELSALVVDTLERVPELQAYGEADRRLAALNESGAQLDTGLRRAGRANALGAAGLVLVVGFTIWATLIVALPAVRSGQLSAVLLVVVVLLPLALADVLAGLPSSARELTRATGSARRVFEVVDAPDPVIEPEISGTMPPGPAHLRVEGLAVRWHADTADAVAGVDLDLPPGRRVAVVGPSGAGKTTIALALLRFLEPSAGRVQLNGIDTRDLDGDAVRSSVGLLAQDAHIFDSTVRENLRLARPDATLEQLREALRRARLLDRVDALSKGLDSAVGEHGERLSGGERQRLALARVLLADFPVLVLDEPTEHLDLATADDLVRDLLDEARGRSLVVVSHRLRGLEELDEILVLSHGRVVERGRHEGLMAASGWYAEAYERERGLEVVA
jgi:thiol reductant ABC exporter CydC subunit